jgi:hypothetical protein
MSMSATASLPGTRSPATASVHVLLF